MIPQKLKHVCMFVYFCNCLMTYLAVLVSLYPYYCCR